MAIDPDLRRQITRALLMVAGIAVVIGLVVALTATAALRMAGLSGEDGPAPTVSAPEPDNIPTPDTVESPSPSPTPSPGKSPSESPSPKQTKSAKPKPEPKAIRLHAGSNSVGSMQEVTLSGRYPGGNGTTLQVQRREGGAWTSFPTSATVENGRFETYVALGQPGPNRMRVVDPSTGKASNVVTITIS